MRRAELAEFALYAGKALNRRRGRLWMRPTDVRNMDATVKAVMRPVVGASTISA